MSAQWPRRLTITASVLGCPQIIKALSVVRFPLLLLFTLTLSLFVNVFATSMSLQTRSFNESSVSFVVSTTEPVLPAYISLHGRTIGASAFTPLRCSSAQLERNSSFVFLTCSVTAFVTLEVQASYDLPIPGYFQSQMVLACTGFPLSAVSPPKAIQTNDTSVLLQWSPVLDVPSPTFYVIFSQRTAFPLVRTDVPNGRLEQWVHGFLLEDIVSFTLMGCNRYSSGLLPDGLSCVNSSIFSVTVTPPPQSPQIYVRPLPNCRLLVSLFPVDGVQVTEYFIAFVIDSVVAFQVNISLQNFTSPIMPCAESILVQASARNLHSDGFSDAKSLSAYTQAAIPAPRSLISLVSADRVTFSWLKPHPYSDTWRYYIRCFIDGVAGCPYDTTCMSMNRDALKCIDTGDIIQDHELYTILHLPLSTNVTIVVQSMDDLGFHSNESIVATGMTSHGISETFAPAIISAVLSDPDCALIQWTADMPVLPPWSYLQISAAAYAKSGVVVASVIVPFADSTVRLCSIPSGVTVSLLIILNTSLGVQVSSPLSITTPATIPKVRPALLFTRWISWHGASLCVDIPDVTSAVGISSYHMTCDGHFVARLDPSLEIAVEVALFFDVSNFTFYQPSGNAVNYSCFTVLWPIYIRPTYCSIMVIYANSSLFPPNSTTYVKWQPAANFSVSSEVKIVGVTTSCVVFDISFRGKILEHSMMCADPLDPFSLCNMFVNRYVQASQSSTMSNIQQAPPFSINSSISIVDVCPKQFEIFSGFPLFYRVYFTNFNVRSNIKMLATDSPILNYPVIPRLYPSSPRQLRLQYIDSDFVHVLFWSSPDFNSDLSGFQIMFANASTPKMSPFSGLLPTNQSSFVLKELTKGTRYYFAVHSVSIYHYPPLNPNGSETISLSLDSIPDSVANLIVSSYSDDTVTLSWKTVSYPRAAAFNLFCNRNSSNQNHVFKIVSSTLASVDVEPFSDGICSVFACADMICSRKSRPSFVKYNITSAPVPVTRLFITNILESSLSLMWLATDFAREYMIIGTLSADVVTLCECGAAKLFDCIACLESRSIFSPRIVSYEQTSLNVSGLATGIEIFLFVFSRSASGARWIGNTSSIVSATPVPPPQHAPIDLALVNISSDNAFIKWGYPQSSDLPTEYRVLVVPNGSMSNPSVYYVHPSKFSTNVIFQLKPLLWGFTYYVTVKGRNNNIAAYDTATSNEASLNITLVQPCIPPIRLKVVSVTSSSILVDWEISAEGPEILQIFAFYRLYDVKMVLQSVLMTYHLPKNQRSYNFTGLKTQQTYMLSVATVGYNVDYSSSTSSVISQAQEPFNRPPQNLSLLFANETVFDIAWNAPSLPVQPQYLVSLSFFYEVYACFNSCMTADIFPQTARPNDEFVDSFGDLFRWTGLEWVSVLPPVNSYSFVAALNSSTRSFSLQFSNTTTLFIRVCAFNFNRDLVPSSSNCAYLRNIRVNGLAPTPLLVAGTNPTISTISLNWVVSCPESQADCLQGAFFVIQYSVFGSGLWTGYPETSTISSMTIKNLFPGTTYIFRVSSVNNAGASPWSESSQPSAASTTYNTPGNLRVFVIERVSRSSTARVAVDLYWDALPNIASHIFKVEYEVPGVVGWNLAISGTNGSRYSAIVPDIRQFDSGGNVLSGNGTNYFAPYRFRVTGGTEKYGIDPVDVSSTTSVILPALPLLPPALTSLTLTSNSFSSALVGIVAPPLAQTMLGLSSQLFFRAFISSNDFASGMSGFDDTRPVFFQNRLSYPVYSTIASFQIDGLVMNVTYTLRVQTITANSSVSSGFSTLRFQLAPVPGPPENVYVKMVSLNSVVVAWSPPAGAVSGYMLQFSVNSSVFQSAGDVGLSREGTIRNLPSNTTVLIAVRARSLHAEGYGAASSVFAFPTLSCDAETSLNLSWANTTHMRFVWNQGNPVCIRLQQLQIFFESGWSNTGIILNSDANSSFIQCSDTKSIQVRRISFSYNPQDMGTVSSVVNSSCAQAPRPVFNLVPTKTYDSSLLLEFDHEVDLNGMSFFRVDTYCPEVFLRLSEVHQFGKLLNDPHVSLIVSQIPKCTPCQCIVYHGNSHPSGIENTGSSTLFFSLEPPIEWIPENITLVGFEIVSEHYVDVTLSYVLKNPQNVSFVGVFLVDEDATFIFEESVTNALSQITVRKLSANSRSCLTVLCRNLNSEGYTTRFHIREEQVVCIAPTSASPVIDVKIISASLDPVPSVNLLFTATSASKFVRFQLFKTLIDRSPFYVADRTWALNNTNLQPVTLETLSSPVDLSLQYNITDISVGHELYYMCLLTWNYDATTTSTCNRRMLYFTPVNAGAFLSAAVSIEFDRRIELKIRLSPGHSASVLIITVFPCSINSKPASDGPYFYTTNVSLPYCTNSCESVFEIPSLMQSACYELHSRLYNRDVNWITKYSRCDHESYCKSVIFAVPALQYSSIRSMHVSRVFFNHTIKLTVFLSSPADGMLCIRRSANVSFSGKMSCNSFVLTNSENVEYDLLFTDDFQSNSTPSLDVALFDVLGKVLFFETFNVSIPSVPLKSLSFVALPFFNNATTASVSLTIKLMDVFFPIRFHAIIWPVSNSACAAILKFALAPCSGSKSVTVSTSPIIIGDLSPSQQYCISLRYLNAVGWSPWSDDECSIFASSRPFLRAFMIASNGSASTVFVAATVFNTFKMLQISSAHFSADLDTAHVSNNSSLVNVPWSFNQDYPQRSFLLSLLMDPSEKSANFTFAGFITVQRPQINLPFLLSLKLIDESGQFALQVVNLAFCYVVLPPVSLSIQMINRFEFDLRLGLSPSNIDHVLGYEIMCTWPDSFEGSTCSCAECLPSTLLVPSSNAQSGSLTLRFVYNSSAQPSVFVRTLGFAGHSEYVQVVSVNSVPPSFVVCPDLEYVANLPSAFLDQDNGDVFVPFSPTLYNFSANVEISFSATSGWIPMVTTFQGQFLVCRVETLHQVIFVRLRLVDSSSCVYFTSSISVETLPPRNFLFPTYDVNFILPLIYINWSLVNNPTCSPFVQAAYAQPCPQIWTNLESNQLQNGIVGQGVAVSLSNLTSLLAATLSRSRMTLNDVAVVNSSGCVNWFALRAVCSHYPIVFDIHKRFPLNIVSGWLNSTLVCEIEAYSNSAITIKISEGFIFDAAYFETYWTVLANAGTFFGQKILVITSVVVHEKGYVLLSVKHSYPPMASLHLQVICRRFNLTLNGQVTAQLLPPPFSPAISWVYTSPSTLQISWAHDINSQATSYRIRISADGEKTYREFFTNSSFVEVSGMSRNVSYKIFSSARNRHSAGFVFQSETVALFALSVPQPACLSVVQYNAGGVVISWCTPQYSQILTVSISASFSSICETIHVHTDVFVDTYRRMAILYGLNEGAYDVFVTFKTQDQKASAPSHLKVYPSSDVCLCRVEVEFGSSEIRTHPCQDLYVNSVKLVFDSARTSLKIPVASSSFSMIRISDEIVSPGLYKVACVSEYYSGAVVSGPIQMFSMAVAPVDELTVVFANSSVVSLVWKYAVQATFRVAVKDRFSNVFNNFSTVQNSSNFRVSAGRVYDVWVTAIYADLSSLSKTITISAVDIASLTVPQLYLTGTFDTFISVSWSSPAAVQSAGDGMFRYVLSFAMISESGVISPFVSSSNVSNPAISAAITLPFQLRPYAIQLSICISGMNVCQVQLNCAAGMSSNQSGCLVAMTAPRPPPPTRVSLGLFSASSRVSSMIQVPVSWMPSSALSVLLYRILVSCDPCPAGSIIQSTGSSLSRAEAAVLLNVTTNSTNFLLDLVPYSTGLLMRLELSALGSNSLGFGESAVLQFRPARSCSDVPICSPNLVSIASSNISSITLLLSPSPCGSNFEIEAAINGGGFYPVAPITSGVSSPIIQVTSIGGTPYFAPSDFVIFSYSVRAISGLKCMDPFYFNTSSIVFSRTLNFSQYLQSPTYSSLQVVSVKSDSAVISITGAAIVSGVLARLMLLLRDSNGGIVASSSIQVNDHVRFSNLPPNDVLYLESCSVPADSRSTACIVSYAAPIPVYLHDPLPSPDVTVVNTTSGLRRHFAIRTCSQYATSLQVFALLNGTLFVNLSVPSTCPMTIPEIFFPFCGIWILKTYWISAAGSGSFTSLNLSIFDDLRPLESVFAEVIIGPFETPRVRVSWQQSPPTLCANDQNLQISGYDVTCTFNGTAVSARVPSASRSVVLPLGVKVNVGMSIIVSVQLVQTRNDRTTVVSRPVFADASLFDCDDSVVEVIADATQAPVVPCSIETAIISYSGPLSFPSGVLVPFQRMPSSIAPEMRGKVLNVTIVPCTFGACALLHLPEPGPVGTVSSLCIHVESESVTVTWCMKVHFKIPRPFLFSSLQSPVITGLFCDVDVDVSAVGHRRLPEPILFLSNVTKSSMLRTVVNSSSASVPDGMNVSYISRQRATVSWNAKLGQQGFLYTLCFGARYPLPSDGVLLATSYLCVAISARPCSACLITSNSMDSIASLWNSNWVSTWISTPPFALFNYSMVTLGPTMIISRNDSGDGIYFANLMGLSMSDLVLWNPHAGESKIHSCLVVSIPSFIF